MKLILYSGGDERDNHELDQELLRLAQVRKPQVTFIPSSSYLSHQDFSDFVQQYSVYDIDRFIHFPVDIPYSETLLNEVLRSDIIHLGGGNTFYFLQSLRRKKLIPLLKKFVRQGGVLTGLSAGAIIMTKNITTAGFPSFDKDENEDNLKKLGALNLVNFDFFPHYKNSHRYDKELCHYSKQIDRPLYACTDGSGVVIQNKTIKFIGKVSCFFRGQKFKICL